MIQFVIFMVSLLFMYLLDIHVLSMFYPSTCPSNMLLHGNSTQELYNYDYSIYYNLNKKTGLECF